MASVYNGRIRCPYITAVYLPYIAVIYGGNNIRARARYNIQDEFSITLYYFIYYYNNK